MRLDQHVLSAGTNSDQMEDIKDVEAAAAGASAGTAGMSGGQGGRGGPPGGGAGGMPGGPAGLQYSIPGILHFLQHEWARFEMERGQWDVEKAEYQVSNCPYYFLYNSFTANIRHVKRVLFQYF